MRILLLGDYSNVHNTLAKGLKALGHECVVASDGDHWKDYPRDIDLKRDLSTVGTIGFLWRLMKALPSFRGYDIVQIINPIFIELKAEKMYWFYDYLRKHNKKIVLGAFGMDYYWAQVNTEIRPLRYSDFNIGDTVRMDPPAVDFREDWIGTPKEALTKYVAHDVDWIVAGLQEYWATYNEVPELKDKMCFIPFPIITAPHPQPLSHIGRGEAVRVESTVPGAHNSDVNEKVNICTIERANQPDGSPSPCVGEGSGEGLLRLFVGISRNRSAYKGTDIMLAAAKAVKEKYPDRLELQIAEGVPFAQYQYMMDNSDAILDQLYSYTPAMNSLLAMSKGIINIGGGEPENYEIIGENELRPIVNVLPTFESCYDEIEKLVLHPEIIPELKRQSIEYVKRHHDYIKVAKQYETLYEILLR